MRDKIIMKPQRGKAFTAFQSPVIVYLWATDILRLTQRQSLHYGEVTRVTLGHTDH